MNLEQMKSRLKSYIQLAMESFPTKGEQFYSELVEVLQSKGNDYSNEDRLSNFKEVGNMTHTDPRVVCATLIGVKVSRICNLLKSGKSPDNESVKDSILDLSNYSILLHLINLDMEESMTKRKKEGTDFGTKVHESIEKLFTEVKGTDNVHKHLTYEEAVGRNMHANYFISHDPYGSPEAYLIKEFEIWMEGYSATGESGTAQLIGKGIGANFDEAVQDYMSKNPDHGIKEKSIKDYTSEEGYNNRSSNWSIWACNLFDNEADARKSFG